MNNLLKSVYLVLIVIGLLSTVSADQTISSFETEEVEVNFQEETIYFEAEQLEKELQPQDVFVPEELEQNLDDFSYSLQTFDEEQWPDAKAQLFLQVQYTTAANQIYPTDDLNAVLGGDASDSDLIENQFQYSDFVRAEESAGKHSVFNTEPKEVIEGQRGNDPDQGEVRFQINVSTHNEHLIIDYEVIHEDYETGIEESVTQFTDVFSDEKPDLATLDNYFIGSYIEQDEEITRVQLDYDNKHRPSQQVNVTLAYPNQLDVQKYNLPTQREQISDYDIQRFNNQALEDGVEEEALLLEESQREGLTFETFQVTVPANTVESLYYNVEHTNEDEMYMWVEGSNGGGGGTPSTDEGFAGGDGSESTPYQVENCDQLQNLHTLGFIDEWDENLEEYTDEDYYELISDIDCSDGVNIQTFIVELGGADETTHDIDDYVDFIEDYEIDYEEEGDIAVTLGRLEDVSPETTQEDYTFDPDTNVIEFDDTPENLYDSSRFRDVQVRFQTENTHHFPWRPIGVDLNDYRPEHLLDGNGHTIRNLHVEDHFGAAGLWGELWNAWPRNVDDLNIEDSTFTTSSSAGTFAADGRGEFFNVTARNITIDAGGGISGISGTARVDTALIENSELISTGGEVGGITTRPSGSNDYVINAKSFNNIIEARGGSGQDQAGGIVADISIVDDLQDVESVNNTIYDGGDGGAGGIVGNIGRDDTFVSNWKTEDNTVISGDGGRSGAGALTGRVTGELNIDGAFVVGTQEITREGEEISDKVFGEVDDFEELHESDIFYDQDTTGLTSEDTIAEGRPSSDLTGDSAPDTLDFLDFEDIWREELTSYPTLLAFPSTAEIEEGELSIEMSSPSQDISIDAGEKENVTFTVTCEGGDDALCVDRGEQLEVWFDPEPVEQETSLFQNLLTILSNLTEVIT